MINASDLSNWDFCPRKVYFQKVLGIVPEKKEIMVKGTIKHKIFEEVINSLKERGDLELHTNIEAVLSKHVGELEKFGTNIDDFREELIWSFRLLEKKINEKEFDIPKSCEQLIESKELGLKGKVDVVFNDGGEWIIGDLKTRISDFLGPKLQIGACALLFENKMNVKVDKFKIISHGDWREMEVNLTDELRKQILETRDQIKKMLEYQQLPPLCSNLNKCTKCEFWDSHCNI